MYTAQCFFSVSIEVLAQKSTCDSTFQAIEKAMMGSGEIYTSNGVGAVICSRHGLVRAQGVADIQKGEK